MKERFSLLLSDNFVRISLILSLIFLVPLIALIILTYRNLPPYIPFFNSMPWGEERLFPSYVSLFLPLIILTVFVGNIVQSIITYKKYALIARILSFTSFLFLFLGLLAYLQILFLSL